MIIDYQADYEHASCHEILDAATGEPLPMEGICRDIFYADDERGIIRHHVRDNSGAFMMAHEGDPTTPIRGPAIIINPVCAAWREVEMPIRIVRKPGTYPAIEKMARWIGRKMCRPILFTPIGDVEWIVNLHYRCVMGAWPPKEMP